MPIFARVSAMSGMAEHMMELKDPNKSPTGNCSKKFWLSWFANSPATLPRKRSGKVQQFNN